MSVPDETPAPVASPEIHPPDSPVQAFSSGIALKCPLCRRGRLFSGWFQMHHHCNHCGFQFERDPGYFLGSTYINYGLTTLLTTWTYIVLRFGASLDKTWLIPGLAGFCVIFPLVFFRYARSLWLSFDCYFDRAGALESRSESGGFLDSNSSQKN
jgi:uncharacterized protein (DUF983 family)